MEAPSIAVVIVTYDAEGAVGATLDALTPQLGERDELVVVDNASSDRTLDEVRRHAPGARVIEAGHNSGFAAACNLGAAGATADLLLFLNPDARPERGAIDALRGAAADHPTWGAWQALVLLPGGGVNTSGGVVHFLGVAWAGVADAPAAAQEVAFASGAALTVRAQLWRELEGFDDEFFMYCEDVDLSLRLRLAGHGVGVEPAARVVHDYVFHKGTRKWFLLERNRWWTLLAVYPAPLLIALAPALLGAEAALLAVAAAGGWLGAKLRADAAVIRTLPRALRRRRAAQAHRRADLAEFARSLTPDLSSPYLGRAGESPLLRGAMRAYWRLVVFLLRI
jgi:GT2 family glycosyltransferase